MSYHALKERKKEFFRGEKYHMFVYISFVKDCIISAYLLKLMHISKEFTLINWYSLFTTSSLEYPPKTNKKDGINTIKTNPFRWRMTFHGIHSALVVTHIQLPSLRPGMLSLFYQLLLLRNVFLFQRKNEIFPMFSLVAPLYFISLFVPPIVSVFLLCLSFLSAPQWTCWQADLP